MPLLRSSCLAWAVCAWLAAAGTSLVFAAEATLPVATAAQPTVDQIEQATELVRQDPNMGTERKIRSLKWKSAKKKAEDLTGWRLWLLGLFGWIARSARLIIWVLAAVLAAFIAIYIMRALATRRATGRKEAFAAPSHVRDLDIRPESLPADIGAAALQLWERGEQRRALALLYRGLLSRMVHAHRAPVRDSTTEGECIVLARRCLPVTATEFATGLVNTWQRAVYGDQMPAMDQVRALCAGFAPLLDPVDSGAGVAR